MKNKGFTLIELLAVIVILAIIALIATPIILGIIEDAKNNTEEENINLYAKAVENAVANYVLKNPNDTNITVDKIKEYIKYDGNKVECDITINEDKTVNLNNCKINDKEVEYTYGSKSVCKLEDANSNNQVDIGEMVTCGTGDKAQRFYVMPDHETAEANTVSMLAEYNITITEINPVQDKTGATNSVAVSSTNYWGEVDDGTFVYDDRASISTYVNAYKETLTGMGVSENIVVTLPSTYQLTNSSLGCSLDNCFSAPSWTYSTRYWLGSISFLGTLYAVQHHDGPGNGYISNDSDYFDGGSFGVRPVVIIPKGDLGL